VYEHSGGRVLYGDDADPVHHLRTLDRGSHTRGDVDGRDLRPRLDGECLVMDRHVRADDRVPIRFAPMRTWGEARSWAIARLVTGADPATAALDADVLLAFTLGGTKEEVFAHPERPLAAADDARFVSLVERRYAGEPVAYLRGFKEFCGMRLMVDPRVLIPR